jgi:hypothetical protein
MTGGSTAARWLGDRHGGRLAAARWSGDRHGGRLAAARWLGDRHGGLLGWATGVAGGSTTVRRLGDRRDGLRMASARPATGDRRGGLAVVRRGKHQA